MTSSRTPRRRFYNSTGERYEPGRYGDRHMGSYRAFRNDTLLRIIKDAFGAQPLRVLEVGCGTGLSLEFLAQAVTRYSLFGLDASETMLRQAALKGSVLEDPPKLVLGDAVRLPYSRDLFDVVFATRFIHQFPHEVKRGLWEEFRRVVRPGGLIVLEFYARPYHWLRYYLGARKGRTRDAYFQHYPSLNDVRNIVGEPIQIHPLRLLGSRIVRTALGERLERRATRAGGRILGGVLLDEYFIAARKH
jgi:SAM-dependent methyltransferase